MSKKRFNEIKNIINKAAEDKLKTKALDSYCITITGVKNLLDRINTLNPTNTLENETNKMYNKIVNDDFNNLINLIAKKGIKDSRERLFKNIACIVEIFTGKKPILSDYFQDIDDLEDKKLDTATGGQETPELETAVDAKNRLAAEAMLKLSNK